LRESAVNSALFCAQVNVVIFAEAETDGKEGLPETRA
jgi:hypothetical protein